MYWGFKQTYILLVSHSQSIGYENKDLCFYRARNDYTRKSKENDDSSGKPTKQGKFKTRDISLWLLSYPWNVQCGFRTLKR